MNGKQQRPFVYGTFRWPVPRGPLGRISGGAEVAIEILREFGTTELIGKLYIRLPLNGPWAPTGEDHPQVAAWHQNFERFRQNFLFDMAGSGVWEVLHFRTETDETGPYVAVALRYSSKRYPWVDSQRAQEHSS